MLPRLGETHGNRCHPGGQRTLTKEFRGFVAVNGVDLRVRRGTHPRPDRAERCGQDDLFNLLTKFLSPSGGHDLFKGRDITGVKPADVARLGLVRSFQISAVFPHLTRPENVRVALQTRRAATLSTSGARSVLHELDAQRRGAARGSAWPDRRRTAVDSLGRKRALEIATTLALDPEVLLLDEPTAGMGHEDMGRTWR